MNAAGVAKRNASRRHSNAKRKNPKAPGHKQRGLCEIKHHENENENEKQIRAELS